MHTEIFPKNIIMQMTLKIALNLIEEKVSKKNL